MRADPFHYELYDLKAFFDLATLAQSTGIDLFNFATADGRGLHKAFDFMVPYVDPNKMWPYPQTNTIVRTDFIELLRRASVDFHDPQYEAVLQMYFGSSIGSNLMQIEYPEIAGAAGLRANSRTPGAKTHRERRRRWPGWRAHHEKAPTRPACRVARAWRSAPPRPQRAAKDRPDRGS